MKKIQQFYQLIDSWAYTRINNTNQKYIEKLVKIFKEIDRADFVPLSLKDSAYENTALPTYYGQTISQPEIVFDMTYFLEVNNSHSVLEIGTGVGYQTAILAKLAKNVYTIERIDKLSKIAQKNITKYNLSNIQFFIGDGSIGIKKFAPYDRIIVTAAAPFIPSSLKNQLKKDGIIVIPVGRGLFSQVLIRFSHIYGIEKIYGCAFVKLIGKEGFNE